MSLKVSCLIGHNNQYIVFRSASSLSYSLMPPNIGNMERQNDSTHFALSTYQNSLQWNIVFYPNDTTKPMMLLCWMTYISLRRSHSAPFEKRKILRRIFLLNTSIALTLYKSRQTLSDLYCNSFIAREKCLLLNCELKSY